MAELAGLAESVAELVSDGDSVALEGFTHRIPMAAGHELLRQGRRELEHWIGPGRIQVAFLGAAQVDRHANLNSTVIGDYERPRTRLPGAGGAPEIATGLQEVVVIVPHGPRTFVPELDFRTTSGERTTAVVTDLGVLEPPRPGEELVLTAVHPGVAVEQVRAATGWDLRVAGEVAVTEAPTREELGALRELVAR